MANNISHGNCSMTVSYDYISVIDRLLLSTKSMGVLGSLANVSNSSLEVD
jgi:hypothetical protein